MKTKLHYLFIALTLLALSTLNSQLSTLHAQGTAFIYEGQLQNNGSPASGNYNLMFTPYVVSSGGFPLVSSVTTNGVIITNGLFTVTIDFGGSVFTGQTIWLEIGVESNGVSSFTTLAPRQQLTPTPYAIYAESVNAAGLTGTIPAANFGGTYANAVILNNPGNTFTGNGAGLTGLNASQLTSIGNNNGGIGNFFVGLSGNATASGSGNTALGNVALNFNTSGSGNAANGFGALFFNSIGSYNTADGYEALINATTGSNNIALGYEAGFNVFGSSNIDIGNLGLSTDTNIIRIGSGQSQTYFAGNLNGNGGGLTNLNVSASQLADSAGFNLFVGEYSGNAATTGDYNTAVGTDSLNNNTTGSFNTALGEEALNSNTSGSQNTAAGDLTLNHNLSGSDNIALGTEAGYFISTGSSNIDIGNLGLVTDTNIIRIGIGQSQTYLAGVYGATPNQGSATAVYVDANGQLGTVGAGGGGGSGTLPSYVVTNGETAPVNLSNNLFVTGLSLPSTAVSPDIIRSGSALLIYADGSGNFFAGQNAGNSATTGDGGYANTAEGVAALSSNTTGGGNTADGDQALYANTMGSENTASGWGAMSVNTTGSHDTAVGAYALPQNQTGSYNTAVGEESLYSNTNGNNNTAVGYFALNFNKSGSNNVASGNSALNNNVSGSGNSAMGVDALEYDSSGNFNTALGYFALWKLGYAGTVGGTNNIALGYQAAYNFTGTESSNIDIGNPGMAGENNTIRIGASQSQTFIAGVINGNGGGLTNLNAAQLTGTLATAQLPAGLVTNKESGVTLNGTFSGDGSGLTGLDASQLVSVGNAQYNFLSVILAIAL